MGADEVATLDALTARREILDGLIASHGGRIANTAGDSVLAEFGSAVDAVRCAMEAQGALAKANSALPENRQHQGIIFTKFKGAPRQSASLSFIFSISNIPAKPPPLDIASCSQCEWGCITGIKIVGCPGELKRLYIRFWCKAIKTCQGEGSSRRLAGSRSVCAGPSQFRPTQVEARLHL
jgi:hypothetical protein